MAVSLAKSPAPVSLVRRRPKYRRIDIATATLRNGVPLAKQR